MMRSRPMKDKDHEDVMGLPQGDVRLSNSDGEDR